MVESKGSESKLARARTNLKKSLRLLNVKNRLRLLQNQYDSKMIKTLYNKNKNLYQDIVKELKPDYNKMQADKRAIYDEIDRMKNTGRWVKTKKKL